ncbi:cytochrome c-type protein NapC, partial [Salmonella enterica subsp. enterica serovar Infantis]
MENTHRKPGWIQRVWRWWRRPSRLALGTLLFIGVIGGISGGGGFNTGMAKASTEEGWSSCPERRNPGA